MLKQLATNSYVRSTFAFLEQRGVSSALFLAALSVLMFAATLMQSCTSLGIANADTFNKKVAVAYTTVNATTDITTDLLIAKKISVDDARAVRAKLNDAVTAIAAARAGYDTDPKFSENKLADTLKIVAALQTFLQSKQVSPP